MTKERKPAPSSCKKAFESRESTDKDRESAGYGKKRSGPGSVSKSKFESAKGVSFRKDGVRPATQTLERKRSPLMFVFLTGIIFGAFFSGQLRLPFPTKATDAKPKLAETSKNTNILPTQTIKVKEVSSYTTLRTYTGQVSAPDIGEIGFERSGKVIEILSHKGERVQPGQILARLDTRILEANRRELYAQRNQAQAQLRELEAGSRPEPIVGARADIDILAHQIQLARNNLDRRRSLYAEGAIAKEQLDEAETEVDILTARMDKLQSQLAELLSGTRLEKIDSQIAVGEGIEARLARLEIEIENSYLRADFESIISESYVEKGSVISPGQPVFRIVSDQFMEAEVGIPIDLSEQVKPGSQQRLSINGELYEAEVSAILPELDPQARTLQVILQIRPNDGAYPKSGQIVKWELSEEVEQTGYWIPLTALAKGSNDGLWSCYVLRTQDVQKDGGKQPVNYKVERREIKVIHTGNEGVIVRGGLSEGDLVVANGTHRVIPGQLVEIEN